MSSGAAMQYSALELRNTIRPLPTAGDPQKISLSVVTSLIASSWTSSSS